MAQFDLNDELLEHLKDLIRKGMVYITADMQERNITTGSPPAPPELNLVIGETTTHSKYPMVRISAANYPTDEWLATGVRNQVYELNVDLDMRGGKQTQKDRIIAGMATAVKNWLMHMDNLSGTIFQTSATYYDAWCGPVTMGVKGDGNIRTARFIWRCQVANSYYPTQV